MYNLFYTRSSPHGVALSRDRDRDGARAAAQLPGSCSLLAQLTLRHLVTSICTRPCQRACFASWRDACARLRRQDPSWSALSQQQRYQVAARTTSSLPRTKRNSCARALLCFTSTSLPHSLRRSVRLSKKLPRESARARRRPRLVAPSALSSSSRARGPRTVFFIASRA